jgi:hypothetical protein
MLHPRIGFLVDLDDLAREGALCPGHRPGVSRPQRLMVGHLRPRSWLGLAIFGQVPPRRGYTEPSHDPELATFGQNQAFSWPLPANLGVRMATFGQPLGWFWPFLTNRQPAAERRPAQVGGTPSCHGEPGASKNRRSWPAGRCKTWSSTRSESRTRLTCRRALGTLLHVDAPERARHATIRITTFGRASEASRPASRTLARDPSRP